MRWNEFLDTANRLVRGATEGDWRSAVSRGYYSVFHFFRDLLTAHGVNIGQGGTSHFNLYSGLANCGDASVANIAARIDDLRKARTRADYDINRRFPQAQGLSLVQEATRLIQDFQVVLSSVPPAQIAAGAKRHLQSIGHIP